MGLSVEVGILADLIARDPEGATEVGRDFDVIADALREKGLGVFEEPTACDVWFADLHGYSGLHALREVAGMVWKGVEIPRDTLLDGSQTDFADALAKEFFTHLAGKAQFTLIGQAFRKIFKAKEPAKLPPFVHLVVHSDCDGFYVPVSFETPLVPKRVAGKDEHLWPLGSVMRLEAEVNQLSRLLEIPAEMQNDDARLIELMNAPDRGETAPLWRTQPIATQACLVLREACDRSLRTGAAISFG